MYADILLLWGLEIVSRKCPVYYLAHTSCYPVQRVWWYCPGRWHGRPMLECQSAAPESMSCEELDMTYQLTTTNDPQLNMLTLTMTL